MSVALIIISPLSFLIYVFEFSLCHFIDHFNRQLLTSLILYFSILYFIYFCSSVYYFLPSGKFGLSFAFSLFPWCVKFCFVWRSFFLCMCLLLYTFLLVLTYCIPCFWYVVLLLLFDSRYYLISLMMLSLTYWFFKPVLLSFHIFVNISVICLILIFGFTQWLWLLPFTFVRLVLWLNVLRDLLWRMAHPGKRCACCCVWVQCSVQVC